MGIDGFVDVPGGYLYYRQQGHGPDVVLVNGASVDLRMWDSTVAWLADIARVTTWDCRDTGLSSASEAPYDEIDDLAAVLDAAGVTRATLVGVSNGGRQVLAFAHRHPEQVVKACVVSGSFGEFPDPTAQESAARQPMHAHFAERENLLHSLGSYAASAWDADGWCPALSPDDRRRMIGWQVANDRIMYLEDYNGVELEPPVKARFAEIAVPIAVFAGGRDFEGTQLWARRLAAQAGQATLLEVPQADHFPMLSAPDRFEQFLRDNLS
jgi:pimeloyl-ACP methyl ester carboxylesterase